MKVLMVDLTNRSPLYNAYLVQALSKHIDIALFSPPHVYENDLLFFRDLTTKRISMRLAFLFSRGRLQKLISYMVNWPLLLRYAADFDVVHLQWLPMLEFLEFDLWFFRRLLRINSHLVFTAHNLLPHDNESSSVMNRFAKLYRECPYVIVHIGDSKRQLVEQFGVSQNKVEVIPHGPLLYDMLGDQPCKRHATSLTIGMIGGLHPYKGVTDAIKCFTEIKNRYPNARLILAGKGQKSYLREVLTLVNEKKLTGSVDILYRTLSTTEVVDLYRNLDVSLFPYRAISQSGAALTSLALGVPIAGYCVGGLAEVVKDGICGYLAPLGDIDGLIEACIKIIEKREQLSKSCREWVLTTFSWESAASKMVSLYRKIATIDKVEKSR